MCLVSLSFPALAAAGCGSHAVLPLVLAGTENTRPEGLGQKLAIWRVEQWTGVKWTRFLERK